MRLKNLLLTIGLTATSFLAAIPQAKATTCPNAIAITSLPALNQTVVCGAMDDQSATTIVQDCNGSTFYYGGLEALYTFTPTTTGTIEITYSGQTWSGIFVFSGCPSTTGTTVVACTTSSSASKSLQVAVTSGITYYLMFDTWPSPASPCSGTFSISSCPSPSSLTGTAITTTDVTLNWTAPSTAPSNGYEYEVRTSGSPGSGATGLEASGSTAAGITTATVTGLTPGTLYTVYVRSNCGTTNGNSTWTQGYVFATLCNPITTLPWNDGFESVTATGTGSGNFPACWNKINGDWGTRDAAFASYNDPRTGTRYLTNSWSATNEWMMSPGFQLTGGTSYDFSFYWAGDGFTGWTGEVGVNSVQDSAGATILGAPFVTASVTTQAGTYAQVIRTFTPTTTGVYYFGVRINANGTPWYLGFDDFRVNVTPTCPQPNVLPVTAVTATTATLNWSPATTAPALGYQYETRTSGAPGSGPAGLVASASGVAPSATTSMPVTGLTGTTNYTVYVRAICSAGDSSFWASTTFLTSLDCSTATTITACGQSQSFSLSGTGAYNPIQTPTGVAPYSTPGLEKLYVFTAPVTGPYTLDVSATNSAWVDYFFKPAAGGCGNNDWTFIDDIYAPTPVPNMLTFNLTAGTQYYFLADPEGTGTSAHTFTINCPPTCGAPTNVNVVTTTIGATVSWTQNPPGTPTTWQISVAPQGSPANAGVVSIVNANPATVGGLTPSTPYSFYVRAICGPGDTSLWSAVFDVSTQCLPASLPFTENFSNLNFNFPPTCWSQDKGQLTSTSSPLDNVGYSNWFEDGYLNVGFEGAAKVNIYGTFAQREWLISPSIDLGPTPGNFQVEFDFGIVEWISTTPAALGGDDTVALIISTDNGATWSLANALQVWTSANTPVNATTGGQRFFIPMNGYSGTIKLGWYATNGTTSGGDNDIFVDSVRIISTCTPPSVALGADTTVCGNVTSLTFNAGTAPTGSLFTWSNSFDATTATTQTYDAASVINALNASPNSLANVVTFISTVAVGPNCEKSDTINVAVTYTPRVSSISAVPTGAVVNQYDFAPVGDSFATGYVWSFGDGGVAATAGATHTYVAAGTYTVRLIVSNPCGNDTVTTTITVTNSISDALSDGSSVSIFPNPTAADAVLEVTGGATLRSYQVMSATGALVQSRTIKGNSTTSTRLNTDALAPGVYTLRIQLDKGVVVRKLEVLR